MKGTTPLSREEKKPEAVKNPPTEMVVEKSIETPQSPSKKRARSESPVVVKVTQQQVVSGDNNPVVATVASDDAAMTYVMTASAIVDLYPTFVPYVYLIEFLLYMQSDVTTISSYNSATPLHIIKHPPFSFILLYCFEMYQGPSPFNTWLCAHCQKTWWVILKL